MTTMTTTYEWPGDGIRTFSTKFGRAEVCGEEHFQGDPGACTGEIGRPHIYAQEFEGNAQEARELAADLLAAADELEALA
jgi:hypothetical protein